MGFGLDPLYTPKRHVTGTEIAVFDTSKGIIRVQLDGVGAPIFANLPSRAFMTIQSFTAMFRGLSSKEEILIRVR